ncbi:MAG: hypothetical protein ACE5EA_11330 [Nitrospirota bacterium]
MIVRYFISVPKIDSSVEHSGEVEKVSNSSYDLGGIIGKCENLLTITLILADAYTGLALIFTAKSIVRSENMRKDPFYYLGGTLVNFSYSLMMGFFIRVILKATGHTI